MKKYLLFLSVLGTFAHAQAPWTLRANLTGSERRESVSFVIGTKAYIGTGFKAAAVEFDDFWEWESDVNSPNYNTWTQKANFAGGARDRAVGFSIGAKGYIGTGSGSTQDLWEWNQASNTWTQKASMPAIGRFSAVGFSIGSKGYLGTGWDFGGLLKDFWEWDQGTNIWSQKTDFAGGPTQAATAFVIGNKGYVLGQYDSTFWEWDGDPISLTYQTWIKRANFAGTPRADAVGFSIGTKGYIGTGEDDMGKSHDFWEWDQAADKWTQRAHYPGTPRKAAVGFAIGTKGFIATGACSSPPLDRKDLWEWDPNSACASAYVNVAGNILLCKGTVTSTTLTATFTPASAHVIYNWAPATGLSSTTVANPVVSPTVSVSYTVTAQDTVTGCLSKEIRNVYIHNPTIGMTASNTTICQGQTVSLCGTGGVNYAWSTGQTTTSYSTSCITVNPNSTTTYSVDVTDQPGCHALKTATITVTGPCASSCNNLDLENGNFIGWTGISGTNTSGILAFPYGLYTLGNNSSVYSASQHTLLNINALDTLAIDSMTNQPDVFIKTLAPGGGNYSVRLGNAQTGAKAEGLRTLFTPTLSNPVFSFQFACVFQKTTHAPLNNPGFRIHVFDASNALIPALCDTIHAPDPNYGFLPSGSAPNPTILYKRWSIANINMSAYMGQPLTLEFVNFDCSEGAHWGYTYLDVDCSNLTGLIPDVELNTVSVYPNPGSGIFDIRSPETIYALDITNMLGIKVQSIEVNANNAQINLSREMNGVYFLTLRTDRGVVIKKIIVQK